MIANYNNMRLHVRTEDDEKLVSFFTKIGKKDSAALIFARRQLELIEEATYTPRVIKFEGQMQSEAEKEELERVKTLKEELLDKLHLNSQKALESMLLSPDEFMEIDDLIIVMKRKQM